MAIIEQLKFRLRMLHIWCDFLVVFEGETHFIQKKSTLENRIVLVISGSTNQLPNVASDDQGESVVDGLENVFL